MENTANQIVIHNEPQIKNALIRAIREQLEHRALWLYLLCDEQQKSGQDWEAVGRASIFSFVSLR